MFIEYRLDETNELLFVLVIEEDNNRYNNKNGIKIVPSTNDTIRSPKGDLYKIINMEYSTKKHNEGLGIRKMYKEEKYACLDTIAVAKVKKIIKQ